MMWNNLFLWPFMAGFMALQLIVGIILLIFIIWMIVDCAKRDFKNDIEKVIWIVLMVLTTWVGAIIYYIVIRALNPKGLAKK